MTCSKTPAHPQRGLLSALCLAALLAFSNQSDAGPAAAKDTSFDARVGLFGSAELGQAGHTFFRHFFGKGWPTTRDVRNATLHDAHGASEDTLTAVMCSGLGFKLNDSIYMSKVVSAGRRKGGKPWRRGSDVVATRMEEFAQLSGLTTVPKFNPVLFELSVATPKYKKAWNETNPASHVWTSAGADTSKLDFDAVATGLYAQGLYARRELLEYSHEEKKTRFMGSDAWSGFYALMSLQLGLAKIREIQDKCIVSRGALKPLPSYDSYKNTGPKRWIPHSLKLKAKGSSYKFSVNKEKEAVNSQLYDQAMFMLGACEMIKVLRYSLPGAEAVTEEQKLAATLFRSTRFAAYQDVIFTTEDLLLTCDFAMFILTNLQRLHVDVERRTFRSRSSDNPALEKSQILRTADAGLALYALTTYIKVTEQLLKDLKKRDVENLSARIKRKERTAKTYVKLFARWLRTTTSKGFYDRIDIATKKSPKAELSAASIAMAVRGLMTVKDMSEEIASATDKKSSETAALQLMNMAEDKLWNNKLKLYVGRTFKPGKGKKARVSSYDQLAMIGVLKDLALRRDDVRYLIRLKELLRSMKAKGLLTTESSRGGEEGGDSDKDGLKSPADENRAPVIAPELQLLSK